MPSTDRKLELKAKTSVAQTGSQPFVYAKGLNLSLHTTPSNYHQQFLNVCSEFKLITDSYQPPVTDASKPNIQMSQKCSATLVDDLVTTFSCTKV
jgi:hypothetical protein